MVRFMAFLRSRAPWLSLIRRSKKILRIGGKGDIHVLVQEEVELRQNFPNPNGVVEMGEEETCYHPEEVKKILLESKWGLKDFLSGE